jgi:hypothetical protein
VPDLYSIRGRLDELNELFLVQLRHTQATHPITWLCRRLRQVRVPMAVGHRLDALHCRALELATEWACSAE